MISIKFNGDHNSMNPTVDVVIDGKIVQKIYVTEGSTGVMYFSFEHAGKSQNTSKTFESKKEKVKIEIKNKK